MTTQINVTITELIGGEYEISAETIECHGDSCGESTDSELEIADSVLTLLEAMITAIRAAGGQVADYSDMELDDE